MRKRNQIPPALKHGVYSAMTVLPGESAGAFKRLHKDLIAELKPQGFLEEDLVENIARLTWRKQNLQTYRIAHQAAARFSVIKSELEERVMPLTVELVSRETLQEAHRAADQQARAELGSAWELVEIADVLSPQSLLSEIAVIEKIDSITDRLIKRLLFLRGLKSISGPPAIGASEAQKQLPAE